jgi:hypothetical protein
MLGVYTEDKALPNYDAVVENVRGRTEVITASYKVRRGKQGA